MNHFEHDNQVLFFQWFRLAHPAIVAFAIPNAARRSPRQGAWMKAEGLCAGLPDICILHRTQNYGVLFIEMKALKSKLSPAQSAINDQIRNSGYCCKVARSFEEAKKIVEEYLS